MRYLVFLALILAQLSASCSQSPTCVEPAANYTYTAIPKSDNPNCSNTTPISKAEALKCQHGGKVLVKNGSDKTTQVMTAEEADKHAQGTGNYATSGSLVEDHDRAARELPVTEESTILEAIPKEKRANWLYYDRNIKYGGNGCGIWATAVCNRILKGKNGQSLINGKLTQAEWNKTASDLGFLPSAFGMTPFYLIDNYYQRKGFCSQTKPMEGYYEDYDSMSRHLSDGCDVKLFYAKKSVTWWMPSAYPHIETVVDVVLPIGAPHKNELCSNCYLHTNSWGAYAKISGGWCAEFSHEQNRNFGGGNGNYAWPAHDARVWVQTTCNCEVLTEELPDPNELSDPDEHEL